MIRHVTFIGCLWIAMAANTSNGQEEGQSVEVTATGVKLQVEAKLGAAIPRGTELLVKKANKDWLWVEYKNELGWIKKSDVKLAKTPEQKLDEALDRGIQELKSNSKNALKAFNDALALDSTSLPALFGRSQAYANEGKLDDAIKDLSSVIEMKPDLADAYSQRGALLNRQLRFKEGIDDLKKAISMGMKTPTFLDSVAWTLATTPYDEIRDPSTAITLINEAIEATESKELWYFDTLAAAYAAEGQFDKAIETLSKVFSSKNQLAENQLTDMQKRLGLYVQRIPYREPWKPRNDFEKLIGPPPVVASFPKTVPATIAP